MPLPCAAERASDSADVVQWLSTTSAGDSFSLGNAQVRLQRRRALTRSVPVERPLHVFAHQVRGIIPARLQGFQHWNTRRRIAQADRQIAQPALITGAT